MTGLSFEPLEADPVINVPFPTFSNPDLPASPSPTLERIIATNLVGTLHANKQPKALEKRTLSHISALQRIGIVLGELDNVYLRRDGTTQKDTTGGVKGNMPMNGNRLTGMPVSNANGTAVEHSQMVAEIAARIAADAALDADKADANNAVLTGTPVAPTAATGTATTQIATTEFVQNTLNNASTLVIPNYDVEGAGANITAGGCFYYSTLNIVSPQACSLPVKVYASSGMTVGAAITSSAPLEIEVRGDLTINAPISAPFISIRCTGTVYINAALNTAVGLVNFNKGYNLLNQQSRPSWPTLYWCPILIEAGSLTSNASGSLTGDDVFINCTGDITLGATVRAVVYLRNVSGTDGTTPTGAFGDDLTDRYRWHDGYRLLGYVSGTNRGGNGGTAGGWARGGNSAQASIWRGTNRPLLLHTYDHARGGTGSYIDTAQRGAPGGRVSIYSGGNLTANGVVISARGRSGDGSFTPSGSPGSSGQSAGGGGTVRGVCAGTLAGGTWEADGGVGNGSQEHAGGGGVFLAANAYGGAVVLTASAISNGIAGTTAQYTLAPSVIRGLNGRGIFSVFPPLTPLRY